MQLLQNIEKEMRSCICTASEIYIAVAMMSEYGLQLLNSAKKDCKIKIVVGIDLPTSSYVLRQLKKQFKNNVRYYSTKAIFHPKVYLFKFKDNSIKAIVGSANFTQGGCYNNVELSVKLDNEECLDVKSWFDDIFSNAKLITEDFIQKYREYDEVWHSDKKRHKKMLNAIKKDDEQIQINRSEIIKELILLRESENCKTLEKERQACIDNLLLAVDRVHGFKNFDVNQFLKEKELGHILCFNKTHLIASAKNGSLQKLCKMLWTDKNIATLFDNAKSEFNVYGVGRNIISKLLVMKDKHKFFLWNEPTDHFVKAYGIKFERGISIGTKYAQLCELFQQLCSEVKIPDMAVLDALLYKWDNVHNKKMS